MPWDIKRDQRCPTSKPFGVVKRADNELEGCHTSRDKAGRQLAALNAAEEKSMGDELEVKEEEIKEVEEKAHLIGMEGRSIPIAVTSWEDLDAMIQAEEMVDGMKDITHSFAEMAENIFINDEIEDKGQELSRLASGFAERVGTVSENKEVDEDHVTKEQVRYKEIQDCDSLAEDDDFKGSCSVCQFGDPVAIKGLEKCPFCYNPIKEVA